ncbi:MAG: addiction module protein [Alphaproteobacteria bacterium]|nr:addiction module protein [Alphaproteobacteria bacterium]MCB9794341.1 addiction module protein [Alphaproteobacteria bacterium]
MTTLNLDGFDALSTAERILLLQDLWDRVAAKPERVPVTEAQRAEIERRIDAYEADRSGGISWDEVKRRTHGSATADGDNAVNAHKACTHLGSPVQGS